MSVLFQPQRVGRIELENRFVRSATYYGLADELGHVGDLSVDLMRTLASNDVGLIITGFAFVAMDLEGYRTGSFNRERSAREE